MGNLAAVQHYTALARQAQGLHLDVSQRAGYQPDEPAEVVQTFRHRAVRATFAAAQRAHDDKAEPVQSEEVGDMLECIAAAEEALAHARSCLEGFGQAISVQAARSRMNEAIGMLEPM